MTMAIEATPAKNPYLGENNQYFLFEKDGSVPVEIEYTFPEKEFITFAHEIFRRATTKPEFITLIATDEKQSAFYIWLANKCPMKTFDEDQINIKNIISSIWEKSRTNVFVDINEQGTKDIANKEKILQKEAIDEEQTNSKKGLHGKVFTHRQANHLFHRAIKSKL